MESLVTMKFNPFASQSYDQKQPGKFGRVSVKMRVLGEGLKMRTPGHITCCSTNNAFSNPFFRPHGTKTVAANSIKLSRWDRMMQKCKMRNQNGIESTFVFWSKKTPGN